MGLNDNIVQEVIAPIICDGTVASVFSLTSARSTVTQILSVDDTPEILLFAQDQVIGADVTILTNNQLNFVTIGKYIVECSLQATRQSGTGFIRWYAFWEIDTGSGFGVLTNSTTMESMNSNDAPEIHPVTKALLFLDVTVANTKLRLSHQTDAVARNVGVQATASGGGVPAGVASVTILTRRYE